MLKVLRFLFRLFAALLALACMGAMVVGQAGRWAPRPDAANHFAPLWLAGGLLAAALALKVARGRERKLVVGVAAIAVLLAASRIAPDLAARFAPRSPAETERLKLVQFNAYVLNVSPGRSIDWLLEQDADIVTIEEGEGLPRAQMLRLRARYPYCNGCFAEGYWSNMILSKRAPLATGRFELPDPDSISPILGGWSRFAGPGGEYTVIGVHLGWPWKHFALRQQRALAEFVNRGPKERLILAGDFNMTPWSFGLPAFDRALGLERRTHGQASWPGETYYKIKFVPRLPLPILPIDQVYAGEGWRTVSVRRGPSIGSDHYPIVVELTGR